MKHQQQTKNKTMEFPNKTANQDHGKEDIFELQTKSWDHIPRC